MLYVWLRVNSLLTEKQHVVTCSNHQGIQNTFYLQQTLVEVFTYLQEFVQLKNSVGKEIFHRIFGLDGKGNGQLQ